MGNNNNKKYIILSIALVFAISAIIIFVIIPKYSPLTPEKIVEKINFSNSTWIEQYVDKSVGLFGKDFFQNSAYSYNKRSNKMVLTYASQKSVEEARSFYLALPGARETGRNDETSLNITAEKDGQVIRANNYYSPVARVFELELTLDAMNAEKVKNQLEKSFPIEELAKISEIKDLISGEIFGGYVRYRYDNLDEYAYPNIPIFSRAYIYEGSEEDFNRTINELNEAYPTNKFDETQNTHYYQINGYIVSLSSFMTDANENIITVGIQKMDDQ
jgi:hypothetical protein